MNKFLLFILAFTLCASSTLTQTAPLKYWVQFTDKVNTPYSIDSPEEFLSSASLERRALQNVEINIKDLPVDPDYITAVSNIEGVSVIHASKWFNAVTVQISDSSFLDTSLAELEAVNSVSQIRTVQTYSRDQEPVFKNFRSINKSHVRESYGESYGQISVHNGHVLHDLGFKGEGVEVGVFDSGFSGVNFLTAFSSLRAENRLKTEVDIVDGDFNVLNGGTHGNSVLSIMAAEMPDSIIGTGPKAFYHLFRTEDGSSEYVTEEDNWVRAMEMADSIGIQIVNSSLGYSTFNDEEQNHSYADMDGNTTRISRAADLAAERGILVVTSAGNSGDDPWFYITAPADADSVLSVGAVSDAGKHAWFSSRGPSSDGDIKPEVCSVGYQTVFADQFEGISKGNGTSFSSPVIAGLAACLWQASPSSSAMEIRQAIINSAHLSNTPNDSLGYGIPDFYQAYLQLQKANEALVENQVIDLFPNPTVGCFSILTSDSTLNRFTVIDITGREVLNGRLEVLNSGSFRQIDLDDLSYPSGIYLVNIWRDDEFFYSTKVLKN